MRSTFKQRVLTKFKIIKSENFSSNTSSKISIYNNEGEIVAFLIAIDKSILTSSQLIKLLAIWREKNAFAFPSQFEVTYQGTKTWLDKQLLQNPTRILFLIESLDKKIKFIGHIGLYSFNFKKHSCEIDNVIRGEKSGLKGIMTFALNALIKWTVLELRPAKIYLRVFSDNNRAIELYRRCGFMKYELIPLEKHEKNNMIIWKENKKIKKASKYFLKMIYEK